VSKFDRIAGRPSQEREAEVDETARESNLADPQPESPAASRPADYTAQETGDDDGPHDAARLTPKEDEAVELVTDYGKLGEHVTSVLEAANAAAAKIRDEARASAERLAERTRNEATALLEEAGVETEHLRAETEKEIRETRQRANDYAAEKRREAEGEAAAIVARAKREASEHTNAAQERGSALASNVALSEERLRQLVGGLRDLAGRLEELVQAEPPREDSPNVPSDEASLEESLRPSEVAKRSP
jgi:F0F1-type ATP synthase membrane subunit b/b'